MRATFSSFTINSLKYVLSPVLLVLILGTNSVEAKEAKNKDRKKIASLSLSQPEKASKKNRNDKKAAQKKARVKSTTITPAVLMQNDVANLSDDEVTRIRLIKRYEGVKTPRIDWSDGLRTLNYHYSESVTE